MKKLIDQLEKDKKLSKQEWMELISTPYEIISEYAFEKARKHRSAYYSNDVYIRGLIEFSNYCKNDCFYCGIRWSNRKAIRYRLSLDQILESCEMGYDLGFRTFVLQSGEDPYFTDDRMVTISRAIKSNYPECALTLSLGEKPLETYKALFNVGADRYLLRHETANQAHYEKLHPPGMSYEHRMQCLWNLKAIGFETGTGFMVGSPGQTVECLADDMIFLTELKPHMVGIGPYIPHHETPFAGQKAGTLKMTLKMIAFIRLTLPYALIPATTSLGTISRQGREKGILAGANVVMPNLSPKEVRDKYLLYDNKICTGDEAAECRYCIERRMNSIGYQIKVHRGDCKSA